MKNALIVSILGGLAPASYHATTTILNQPARGHNAKRKFWSMTKTKARMKQTSMVVACLAIAACACLNAQVITTVAGGGPPYPLPALNAPLSNPQAVAFDANGNYYVAVMRQVFKVDTSGNLTLFAGNNSPCLPQTPPPNCGDGGPAVNANLRRVYGLAVDPGGNVYIADPTSARIRKVDTTGTITTFAGNGNHGYSGDGGSATNANLGQPYGVAADPVGNVYIADSGEQRVRVVDPSGIIHTFAGNGSFCGLGHAPQQRLVWVIPGLWQ
jgi:hypothetical protein